MLAFVHIEKSAGKTVARAMQCAYGLRHCSLYAWAGLPVFGGKEYRLLRCLYPRLQSISGHTVRPYSDLAHACPDVRYYTMIRHPLKRCTAHYNFQITVMGKRIPFDDWIDDERYANRQTRYLAGQDDADAAIEIASRQLFFVGLTERLDEAMVLLRHRIGQPALQLHYPPYKTFADTTIATQVLNDPTALQRLTEANRSDLKLYRLVTEDLYPQQIREYGQRFAADVQAFRQANGRVGADAKWTMYRLQRLLMYLPVMALYRACSRRSRRLRREP